MTTNLEHTSGLLPWQLLAERGRIELDFAMCSREGIFDVEEFKKIERKTKPRSIVFTTNYAATTAPIREIVKIAHENGAAVLLTGPRPFRT